MKIVDNNPYHYNHLKMAKTFGECSFLGTFCLPSNDNLPITWYVAWNPDRSKGHKDFFGLGIDFVSPFIVGRDYEEFELLMIIPAIKCQLCQEVIYSSYRHDMRYCSCGSSYVDGGNIAYQRVGGQGKLGKLNLLLRTFKAY